jgi:hypothetical protein
MQCLTDYIGIRWCKATEPESGLWINDLPGISLKALDKIADEEQVTFLEAWNTIQRRAVRRLNSAITNGLSKRFKLNRLVESFTLPRLVDEINNQTAPAAQYRGFTVELKPYSSTLQLINLQDISLFLKADQAGVVFRIFELHGEVGADSATELESFTHDCTVGWNKIPLNKDFLDVQRLFITYDASSVDSVYLQLDEGCACYDAAAFCNIGNYNAYLKGASADTPFASFHYANNTFGLTATVSIQCKYEQLVCNNKSLFATAFWYLLGAEALAERIYTDRINRYTTIDLNKAKELRQEFEMSFAEELKSVLEGLDLNSADCCIECNQLVTSIDMQP